ncbi:hypothetical protein RFI_38389, partial [Reticulomyxa filosa]
MKIQIQILENKLKEWDEEKRMELNKMNWDDIWSIDGKFQQTKTNDLIRMNDIPSIIKTLLLVNHLSKFDFVFNNVNIASKEFEEISEQKKSIQQEIYEKYLEKIKLKNEMDE